MPDHPPTPPNGHGNAGEPTGVSRRSFVKTLGLSAAATTVAGHAEALAKGSAAKAAAQPGATGPAVLGPDPVEVTLKINGKAAAAKIDPSATLLETLRVHLGLTGPKEICDRGACGGCSVLVDGKLTVSCMMLAMDAVGAEITTVEGLAQGEKLDPVQEAFVKHDALQCGFCTPGLVMACKALLNTTPKPTLEQIKSGLAGNICRCGTYTNIFNAALEASGQPPIMDSKGA